MQNKCITKKQAPNTKILGACFFYQKKFLNF